ncbi:hypothetical protein [Agromyces humatus]|uniref:Uncharacterized protein n=1 Tax=Agromyces humatus TaxID=279573 RepID=A0ABP4WQI5_9MICO|nr:hypothetical protein [Agromyces humatus]
MQLGLVFALVWAVLALVAGVALVIRRTWLAETIAAERRSRPGRAAARAPSRTLFVVIGLLFIAMGLFIIGWSVAASL